MNKLFNLSEAAFIIRGIYYSKNVLLMCKSRLQIFKDKLQKLSMSQTNSHTGSGIYSDGNGDEANVLQLYSFPIWPDTYNMLPVNISNYNPYHVNLYQTNCSQIMNSMNQNAYGHRDRRYIHRRYKTHNDEKIMSLRLWEQLRPESDKPGFIFTIMSYNVLSQDLLEKHPYLYHSSSSIALQWESRWNNLLMEIKKSNPDIICLQEVQESHIKNYFSVLESLGYNSVYKRRTGIRTDGCAIYYKRENFRMIDHLAVEFLRFEIPFLNRDNVGIIAKFVPWHNISEEFVVATTHLLYNPRRHDVRLAQMELFLSEIDGMSYQKQSGKHSHVPVVLTGDFNTSPDSELYSLITSGKIRYDHFLQNTSRGNIGTSNVISPMSASCYQVDVFKNRMNQGTDLGTESGLSLSGVGSSSVINKGCLTENFSFRSVYSHGSTECQEGTTYQDDWVTVDYIFYSACKTKNKSEDKLKLLSRWRLPTKQELNGIVIPNRIIGSDHLSLFAKFKLEF